jgi:hypothetical protein
MTRLAIQTHRNTATGTRSPAGRLGTQLYEQGESARGITGFSAGADLDPSPVGTYLINALPGIDALIDHQRQQRFFEGGTSEALVIDVEYDVAQLLGGRSGAPAAFAALLYDLARVPWSSHEYALVPPIRRSPEMESLDQKGTERSEEELEMVDWDVRIETPPPRRGERVIITFREGSYRLPRIVYDPED